MDELKLIKNTILQTAEKYGIKIDKIILFGSRARGDFSKDSDWDILVIIEKGKEDTLLKFLKVVKIELSIKRKLPNDLIILNRDYYEKKKGDTGDISYYATVDGMVI